MRYAIYFATPADDALMRLGNQWLGRNPFDGAPLEQPDVDGLSKDRFSELTTDPRRYGFHGTLKAPFSLKGGVAETDLVSACDSFAGELAPFTVNSLAVNRLGRFLALTPSGPEPELTAFAASCVRHFESFRAPLSDADLARRRNSSLTPAQDQNLVTWGYPYIFDDFRFHMTLSNKLENETEAETLETAARGYFGPVTGRPHTVSSFGLYLEPERGAPFQVHTIFQLTGAQVPEDVLSSL